MKLPSQKRINESDFSADDRQLVKKLAGVLNTDIENVYLALSKRISLKDNIDCTLKVIEVVVNASGTPISGSSFQLDRSGGTQIFNRVIGIDVKRVINLDNSNNYPSSCPFISYTQNEGIINIDNITGLTAGVRYQLTLVAWN